MTFVDSQDVFFYGFSPPEGDYKLDFYNVNAKPKPKPKTNIH